MKIINLKTLVNNLLNGDNSAFDEIYYATRDSVYYTIFNIIKNDARTEELVQEVYIKALKNIRKFNNKNFRGWISVIARNLALDTYKREKKEVYLDSQEMDFVFTSESNSDEAYLLKDMKKVLKDLEFEIVLMHVIGNMTHKHIGKTLDKPLGTVLWNYNQAVKKLRLHLEVE
ncbi:sigma-70 family RNA polymerase sigma factor [Mycoplasmatota bacterium WC44]